MLEQNKPKFLREKLQPSLAYPKRESNHKKNAPNPQISKLDLIEKEGVETALQIEWDQKVQNMTLRPKVNHSFINYTSYTHFDQESSIALTHRITNISSQSYPLEFILGHLPQAFLESQSQKQTLDLHPRSTIIFRTLNSSCQSCQSYHLKNPSSKSQLPL